MEATALQSFLKASRLRQWLERPDCPLALKECKWLFEQKFSNATSAPDIQSQLGGKQVTLPHILQRLLGRKAAILHARIPYKDGFLTTASCHTGNSSVMFHPGTADSNAVPASISYICTIDGRTVLAVSRYLPYPDAGYQDPFSVYDYFPAKTYSCLQMDTLEIVDLYQVQGHFARYMVSDKMIALSLNNDNCI